MTTFEVLLKGGAPWGFRLHGGKEFGTPLRISKVETNGKADGAGIKLFDEVLEINGRDVQKVYHTEALVFVKKAMNELRLLINRSSVAGTAQERIASKQDIMYSNKTGPVTSERIGYDNRDERSSYRDYPEADRRSREWSPDVINDVTRVPDPIAIEKGSESISREPPDNDPEARKMMAPQAPLSPRGFEKVQPVGRGRRRLNSSASSSFEVNEDFTVDENHPESHPFSVGNSALRHLQYNKAEADPGYHVSHTSSLPRSLGKKAATKTADQHRSATLPRKLKGDDKAKQTTVPGWYKEMYKEINKSMEGQSHLSRLLTADAAKGAFRHYDGATSPRSLSPNPQRRQRPKSIHIDKFTFDNIDQEEARFAKDDMNKLNARSKESNLEARQKRHSVHSTWYRQFQKGGEIPSAGLAADADDVSASQPMHVRSRSTDDMLSTKKGLPYQTPDHRSPDDRLSNPAKFEYNNPPDFLELRKKAEAEGALREEREREIRMLQEERRRWLEEEEELRAKQHQAKRQMEEEKKIKARQLEEQYRIQRERELQMQREKEMEMERLRATEANNRRNMEQRAQQRSPKIEVIGKATAIYSFNSQSPSELSFKKGQTLDVYRQIDENWYEGELDGQVGIFPVNYVEVIQTPEEPAEDEAEAFGTMQIEEGIAKAKYKFTAENDKEISFKKNDMITLLRKLDENWYEGEIEDQIGIFPVNYVEVLREPRIIKNEIQPVMPGEMVVNTGKISPKENHTPKEVISTEDRYRFEKAPVQKDPKVFQEVRKTEVPKQDSRANHALNGRDGERHRAVFGYAPMNEDEVELIEGDIISVLEKCDDGWFVGFSQRTGKFGTFPGNYVIPA